MATGHRTRLWLLLAVAAVLIVCGGLEVAAYTIIGRSLESSSSEVSPPAGYSGSSDLVPALVKKLMPEFDYEGVVMMDYDTSWPAYVLVRHRTYPGLSVCIDEAYLGEDDYLDSTVKVLGGSGSRSRAFARDWTARHDPTVIWGVTIDPDYDDDPNVVSVSYFDSLKEFKAVVSMPKEARLRWDSRGARWVEQP